MFLLIDNYDSFTFNLVQEFQKMGADPLVLRNSDPKVMELARDPSLERVCISPGPGRPEAAGLCLEFLAAAPHSIPVLGVCLGHQTLGCFAGAPVEVAGRIMHGKTSMAHHNGKGVFAGLPEPFEVCRYHSLLVKADQVEDVLETTAWTDQGEVMGLKYKDRPWTGVQFHPESILTPAGPQLLKNFLEDRI
ncbi:MAG: anthranilate synthase component [Desulfovibrionales bacterium]|jgi:anthranilate synthase component 2|nr:anthranilate synthase component [Desulfovibrionales bacterium]